MTVFFQDKDEFVLFRTEDSPVIPITGESVRIEGKWYKVIDRTFYYKHLKNMDSNSCTIWVEEE